jgi:hypothetical protein
VTRKIVDVNNPPALRPGMTEAVMQAFVEFASDETTLPTPARDHITTEFRKNSCCPHVWQPVAPTEENMEYLKKAFEETDLGPEQLFCKKCGSASLRDGSLWAYDATARFFGKVPKDRPRQERSNEQGKRK